MITAVVILNWNGKHWLERFLPGVIERSHGARVIVADNGSTDGSLEWLRNDVQGVEVIELKENLGFAGGYKTQIRNRKLLSLARGV